MKSGIHPKYTVCSVSCACGHTFKTRATRKEIKVDICSACHPFYTGEQKYVDSAGRVDKFRKRYAKTQPAKTQPAKTQPAETQPAETQPAETESSGNKS